MSDLSRSVMKTPESGQYQMIVKQENQPGYVDYHPNWWQESARYWWRISAKIRYPSSGWHPRPCTRSSLPICINIFILTNSPRSASSICSRNSLWAITDDSFTQYRQIYIWSICIQPIDFKRFYQIPQPWRLLSETIIGPPPTDLHQGSWTIQRSRHRSIHIWRTHLMAISPSMRYWYRDRIWLTKTVSLSINETWLLPDFHQDNVH